MADPVPASSGILDPNALTFANFIGGAAPQSMAEVQRRRAIAQALAQQKRGFPKNIGEGLTSLGEAVGQRMAEARNSAAEKALIGQRVADPRLALPGPAVPPVAATPAPARAPAPAMTPAPAAVPAAPVVPGPRTDAEDPIMQRQKIAALLQGGDTAQGVPQENFTAAGVAPPAAAGGPASDDDGLWGARSHAIGGIETGGEKNPYATIGKANTKYGNALGRYGVMTANVPKWTQEALGQALTPEQFLSDPAAQDAVFRHRFGGYVARFGEEGAARAWFGGPGNINKTNLTDAYERLSIGDYGKDYLKRLQGATRTASAGASGGADAGASMTIDSATGVEPENPPTPTTIRPMGEGGEVRIPGALEPPSALPKAPTTGRTTTDPRFAIPADTPVAPVKQEQLTPEEVRGWSVKTDPRYEGDTIAHARADALIKYGEDKRNTAYQREVDAYKLKYGTHEKEALAVSAAERDRPKTEADLRKADLEHQTKLSEEEDKRRLGGIAPDVFSRVIEKSHEKVQTLPASNLALAAARRNLIEGKMFTGPTAEMELAAAKLKAKAGWPPDPRIAATEEFKSNVAPIIAAARTSLVGNAAVSDADREAAREAAGGSVKLERDSILNVLAQIEKINLSSALQHTQMVNRFAGNNPERQQLMASFRLPLEQMVPDWAVQRLRELDAGPDKEQAHKDFNEKYHTPGLSQRVLQMRR